MNTCAMITNFYNKIGPGILTEDCHLEKLGSI